jgi:hypothetical protein
MPGFKKDALMLVWRFLWALPCSLLGAEIGLALVLFGARVRRVGRTLEVAWADETTVPRWVARCPFAAITLGQVIVGASHTTLAAWRAHERVHVQQYERWGVIFFLAYPASSLLAWLRGQCPYRGNRFEREAYLTTVGA